MHSCCGLVAPLGRLYFVHIPKSGGTAIEEAARLLGFAYVYNVAAVSPTMATMPGRVANGAVSPTIASVPGRVAHHCIGARPCRPPLNRWCAVLLTVAM
jgi:hypothetical protein